jgi:dsRNA-specific ribonuclease
MHYTLTWADKSTGLANHLEWSAECKGRLNRCISCISESLTPSTTVNGEVKGQGSASTKSAAREIAAKEAIDALGL